LKQVLSLIAKDYKLFRADRVAVSLTFIVPILLIFIWGQVFGNLGRGDASLHLAFVNNSTAPIAKKIESVLDTTKSFRLIKSYTDEKGHEVAFDTNSVKDYVRKGNVSAALVIPVDAYTDTSFGLKLKFYYDPKDQLEMQMIQGLLTQTIMSQIPPLFFQGMQKQALKYLGADSGKAFNDAIASTVGKFFKIDPQLVTTPLSDTTFSSFNTGAGAGNIFKNILQLQEEQLVGTQVANPWATRSVGGWAMMFLLFALTGSSTSLFDEKKSGVVQRILASPVSRVHVLWSKYLYNMSLGFIQLIVLLLGGALLYKIDIFSNFPNLVLVVVAAATACTAFGMLLAAVSRSTAQASGLGTFLILAMSSIGGAWFPVSLMPDFIQSLSKLTLVYWSMDGFLQVLWRGASLGDILPNVGILLGISALITSISVWQFKKGHVF
jgi:ABC-2 type transport system permease protein